MTVDTEYLHFSRVQTTSDAVRYLEEDFPEICGLLVEESRETIMRHSDIIDRAGTDHELVLNLIDRLSRFSIESLDLAGSIIDAELIDACKALYSKFMNAAMDVTGACQDVRHALQDVVNETREVDPDTSRKAESARADILYNIVNPMSNI